MTRRGLFLFLGESFRSGGQGSRVRGKPESVHGQMKAVQSHIDFLRFLKSNLKVEEVSVFLGTYTTRFTHLLIQQYSPYLVGSQIESHPCGLTTLFQSAMRILEPRLAEYDFVMFIRVDLFLKAPLFFNFDPSSKTILFPSICFLPHHVHEGDPRVNDMMLFIPRNLFRVLPNICISHKMWHRFVRNQGLSYADLDCILNTFHDSDSMKDFNPLYFIVNRKINLHFHSKGHIFNKYTFPNTLLD